MLRLAADLSRPLRVVDDQHGNPTSTLAAARAMMMLIHDGAPGGIWHLTCEGEATWAEFARELYRLCGIKREILPVTTAEFPRPAARPADSRLAKNRLKKYGYPPMPHWRDALAQACQEGIFQSQR
jgi:dTDP-4-dehydrorhamnose reductase